MIIYHINVPHREMQHVLLNYIYVMQDIITYPCMIHFCCLSTLINLKLEKIFKTNVKLNRNIL